MKSILINTRRIDHVHFNLTLIRHAETHANADGIIQGSIDTELSNCGYLQSKALGRYLQNHRFSHIYSSDFKRASETARQIHLLNRVSSCEIKFDNLLRERMYGIAQGHTRQWLRELAKENGVLYSNFTPPGTKTTIQARLTTNTILTTSCRSSIDSALDLSFLSSDQQSISLSSSILSRNNSFEKPRNSIKTLLHSPYENHFSDLDILVVSHGAVIRELIKYFAYDLQIDIGQHLDAIQELAPNTSIRRFQVTYSMHEPPIPTTTLELIDYHNKNHLIHNEFN